MIEDKRYSKVSTLLLWGLFGPLGAHRFYIGKKESAKFYLLIMGGSFIAVALVRLMAPLLSRIGLWSLAMGLMKLCALPAGVMWIYDFIKIINGTISLDQGDIVQDLAIKFFNRVKDRGDKL